MNPFSLDESEGDMKEKRSCGFPFHTAHSLARRAAVVCVPLPPAAMSSRVVRRMTATGGGSGEIDRDGVGRRQQQRVDGGAARGARGASSYRPTRGGGFGSRNAGVGAGAGGGDAGNQGAERRRGGMSLVQRLTGALHAAGTFLWNNAGFAPLLLYLAWIPFILASQGGWLNMPTALFGGEGLLGIFGWFRWAIPFVFNLWPYFSDFIVSSTFWVLGVPMLTLATVRHTPRALPTARRCFLPHQIVRQTKKTKKPNKIAPTGSSTTLVPRL